MPAAPGAGRAVGSGGGRADWKKEGSEGLGFRAEG